VIIDNRHLIGVAFSPPKAYTPLLVNPDAVLPRTVTMEGFQSIAWWRGQVAQLCRRVKLRQLPLRDPFDCPKTFHSLTMAETLGIFRAERSDHSCRI
jgi:hypothetical protein